MDGFCFEKLLRWIDLTPVKVIDLTPSTIFLVLDSFSPLLRERGAESLLWMEIGRDKKMQVVTMLIKVIDLTPVKVIGLTPVKVMTSPHQLFF